MNDEIIVNFVAGNCYSLEIDDYFLVFDYDRGVLNIPDDKKTIFFATSKEDGHYSPEILKVANMDDFTYVLSADIAYSKKDNNVIYLKDNKLSIESLKNLYQAKNVHFVERDSYLRLGKEVDVTSYSQDQGGVSFFVRVCGFNIFYGGDSYLLDNNIDKENIFNYLYRIYDDYEEIDIAFLPLLDKNGGKIYNRAKAFNEILQPQIFFPTNFSEDKEVSRAFVAYSEGEDTDIRWIEEDNQEFVIDLE
ncbi:metal-dependent hydrolase [uncultured Anaerococcus sp.]|uniref:metal-dependent hydrolase n=1 Tax=uncultured Anaerococcus sp. TaxID=293428 RepID=UPI002621093C|nr:metal-dependent hydrolase [uncultured Anaerococcus sp.]